MKKNAILVASIMFVAGSTAANRGDDYANTRPVSDPAVSSQYDPASSASVSGYGSHNPQTSVGDYHADSSIRGGSNEARGVARNHLPSEGRAHPMNPAVQADSSIRGGSMQARQHDWDGSILAPSNLDQNDSRVKADSSIRGGSNQARYPASALRSSSDRDDFGQGRSDSWPSDNEGSLSGSANWNPSDDLMKDGVFSSGKTALIPNNDASVNGAVSIPSSVEDESTLDLNASPRIEKDIAGEYNLESSSSSRDAISSDVPSDGSFSSEAVGGPGSTQTGVSSSSESSDLVTPVDTTPQGTTPEYNGSYLFENNRAQGVGSGATGEVGFNGPQSRTDSLAERVKATLTRESTGVIGVTKSDVARNIQVSSHGSTLILKGTVPSQQDKDMMEIRAREISGVQRVDNQLMVTPQADPAIRDLNIGRDLEDKTDSLRDIDRSLE